MVVCYKVTKAHLPIVNSIYNSPLKEQGLQTFKNKDLQRLMAHYSVHVGKVRRSIGQNAIESASYISRSKLTLHQVDKEYNIPVSFTYDYSKQGGLAFSKIYAPDNAPEWASYRQGLWNKAELTESRSNAETAGKIMIALPNELSDEQNIELLEEIVNELVKFGMVVDANIHNDSDGNPHAHLQHTFREFAKNKYGEYDFSALKMQIGVAHSG